MPIKLYEGELNSLSGTMLASWIWFSPLGPTAYSIGYAETPETMRCPFYGWMNYSRSRIYLADQELQKQIIAGDFSYVFLNFAIELGHSFVKNGLEQPIFAGIPHIILTNGNPDVAAAMRHAMTRAPGVRDADWGREEYLLNTYSSNLFTRVGEELREEYEALRLQPQDAESKAFLETMWARYKGLDEFREWRPGRYRSKPFSEALFSHWWEAVTDDRFVKHATLQVAQAWAGSVYQREHSAGLPPDHISYSDFARFYDSFHMPLLPPEFDEKDLLYSLGLSTKAPPPRQPQETAASTQSDAHEAPSEWLPIIRTDPKKFWELVTNPDPNKRIDGASRAADILLCEIVRYGIIQDETYLAEIWEFYKLLVENDMPVKERAVIYQIVQDLVLQGKISPKALLAFVTQESIHSLVAAAVSDYVTLAPAVDGDPMTSPREIVRIIENASPRNRGAAFGGLLHLGDRRICELILPLRDRLSTAEVNEAMNCYCGQLSAATIEFELSWLEKGNLDDAVFDILAGALIVEKRTGEFAAVITGEKAFPFWSVEKPEDHLAMQRWVPVEEYAERIMPRLRALERIEPSPGIMSQVIADWSLAPNGKSD
jgi:hypothetical protein